MEQALPPSDLDTSAPESHCIGLDAPCTLWCNAEVAWTQLPLLDPRSLGEWSPALTRCFGGIKVPPPPQTVIENLVVASGRWTNDSDAEVLRRRQQVVAKHLELLAVSAKRSHINLVKAQTSLAMVPFVVLDDGSLAKPCDIFTALHDGSSDEAEPSSQAKSGSKQKGQRHRSIWSLPKYLRPFRRFLLAVAGPMVDNKEEIPTIRVAPPPNAQLIPDYVRGALNKPEVADLEFAVLPADGGEPKIVYAHRLILAAACEHFRTAFTSGFSATPGPNGRCRIDMPEWVEIRPFLWLLAYLYYSYDPEKAWAIARQLDSDSLPATGPYRAVHGIKARFPRLLDGDDVGDDLCGLLRLSEFYDLEHLKQWTERRLQGLLSAGNVIAMSSHAFFCNASQLLRLCVYHMKVMYADLVVAREWEDLDERIKELVLQQVQVAQ